MPTSSEIFARTAIELQPYAEEIVFIGGWVYALYLHEVEAQARPVFTYDVDVSIPTNLPSAGRPRLTELIVRAGFNREIITEAEGEIVLFRQPGERDEPIDLDLLTEADDPRTVVSIGGQPNLAVQGYPGQRILLDNARWIEAGQQIHPLLSPPRQIRVPTVPAYVLQKGLSSRTRTNRSQREKDLIYLIEIASHPTLRARTVGGMGGLASQYPNEYARWRRILEDLATDRYLQRGIAAQLLASGHVRADEDETSRTIVARVRRLLGETPEADSMPEC